MCIAIDILDTIWDNIGTAKREIERLREEMSTVDKTISDILHELEFCKSLNASQGYKYARMLKNLREDRRYIKNELEELQLLFEKLNSFHIHRLKKSLIDLETRQEKRLYTPRVLTSDKRKNMLNII